MARGNTVEGDAVPSSSRAHSKRVVTAEPTLPADATVTNAAASDDIPTTTPGRPGAQTRQKRILPSRSRRGGPGVGSCDVDVMILETRKRRLESEPLIPATTRFMLTTNTAHAATNGEGSDIVELNESAYGRYFDKPEVQKAYREQQTIQTPEFTQLPDDAIVGGRFRPRSEEEFADTSDAAYEKRHRKYETFEKRQRLREKEKLKHEHYKLKERIEQLRGMDYSAFLALPSSALADPSTQPESAATSSAADTGVADLPGAHINGAAAYNEGERRRKEMLETALALEERYKVLLPPDRKWSEKKEKEKAAKRESLSVLATDATEDFEDEVEEEFVPPPPPPKKEVRSPVKKEIVQQVHHRRQPSPPPAPEPAPAPSAEPNYQQDSDGESEVDFEERDRQRSKQLKLRIKFPPRPTATPTDTARPSPSPSKKSASPVLKLNGPVDPSTILDSITPNTIKNFSAKTGVIIRSKDGKFLPKNKRYITDHFSADSISAPPAPVAHHTPKRKRQRTESTAAPSSPLTLKHYSHAGGSSRSTTCVLMVSAMRSSLLPNSRKTQRHVLAFGTRVPPEIEEVRDFEIPKWLHSPVEEAHDEDILEHGSAYGYSVSVNGMGSVSAGRRGEESEDVEDEGEDEDMLDAKEEEEDELMEWQSGAGDQEGSVEEEGDDIPPIATLDDD